MTDPRFSIGPQLLGTDAKETVAALDALKIVVDVSSLDAVAACAAGALVAMLVRVFSHVEVRANVALGTNPWDAPDLATVLSLPVAPTPTGDADRQFVIGIGEDISGADLWLGGGDWTVRLGHRPQPVEPCRTGLGLHAAAALAVAETMKRALAPCLVCQILEDDLVWNLSDYTLTTAAGVILSQKTLQPDVVFFGAGSVGSSAVGVLSCVPGLAGNAVVVDPDMFDPARNPYRYPVARGTETGPKAEWLSEVLNRVGWNATSYVGTVGAWVTTREHVEVPEIAVSSVDTVDGRLQVADALAPTTLSVGVDGLALHLQREHHGDGFACPFCDFASMSAPMTQVQVHAEISGLTPKRVAELLQDGAQLTQEDVDAAVHARKVRPERAAELVGRRLPDLLRRGYSELSVATAGGELRISAPFVSHMAGVLIAAELVKAASGLPLVHRRLELDLSGLPRGFTRRLKQRTDGRCVCSGGSSGLRRRWTGKLYKEPWKTLDPPTQNSSPP